MQPLFSIITVTWNAEQVIAPTLHSIANQSFNDYEYIVMDGASSDGTLALVRQAGIPHARIFSEPDKGLYDAMNKAIDRAEGKYLIFLNAGDAFASRSVLLRMSEAAEGSPGVIYGQTQLVNAEREVVGMRHLTAPARLTADSFKRGMLVCHQAFVARRDLVEHYDLSYRFSADYDWCIRVLRKSEGNAYVGQEPMISFLTDGLTDKHHRDSLKERFDIMCRYYGTVPTVWRHLTFVPRYLVNKLRRKVKKY
ncbi:MAG: glycosyltransferase [Muribaculaceae bacterium]|nr:glycosyltransferase [Muribaculaceae bacterium]